MSRKPQMKLAARLLTRAHLQDTHWGQIIIEAEKRGYFLGAEISASKNWTTCACGKQDPRIPRRTNWDGHIVDDFFSSEDVACPLDFELSSLGAKFHDYNVRLQNFVGAARCLIAIEKRSHQVLKQARKDDLQVAQARFRRGEFSRSNELLAKWRMELKFGVQAIPVPETEPDFAGAREI